ncbi:MAG: galactose-1-phosphate uridylyltransferase [Candidatus Omnitrophica bacterium]|nr:galactose-1-phosphate uridylyltransferase [Candidatus Omnitrophota bacterium]
MPELRKDPVSGRWVIIATERARRPGNFIDPQHDAEPETEKCPFCDNKDRPIHVVKKPMGGWYVKVIENGNPIVQTETAFDRRGQGLYYVLNGHGVHEVIIETPDHTANMADLSAAQIERVFKTYVLRFNELEKDPHLQCVLAYKNYGQAAGSRRIAHARSQMLATSVNPIRVEEKLKSAKKYYDYHERCLYCDLIQQELAEKKRIVVENEQFLAITPFAPRFPFEIWVLPRKHHARFYKGVLGEERALAEILKEVLLRLKIGLDDPAYNYVIQTAPFARGERWDRWRTIEEDYHWHLEIMPRLTRAAGFEKGTGFYICAIPPEDAAAYLREVRVS